MGTQANYQRKVNSFKISEQVKFILQKKGFSTAFNYSDYDFFKSQCTGAFNKAVAIAEKFMEEATPKKKRF